MKSFLQILSEGESNTTRKHSFNKMMNDFAKDSGMNIHHMDTPDSTGQFTHKVEFGHKSNKHVNHYDNVKSIQDTIHKKMTEAGLHSMRKDTHIIPFDHGYVALLKNNY